MGKLVRMGGWMDGQMFITASYKILNKINEIWYVDRFNALVLVRVKFRILYIIPGYFLFCHFFEIRNHEKKTR